jgi:hypothetical protein
MCWWLYPVSLFTIMIDMRIVFGRMVFRTSLTSIEPSYLELIFVTSATSCDAMLLTHRSIDGCSYAETMICGFGDLRF